MAERMTGRERTEVVLAGGIPDRVPVDLHDFMVVAARSGRPFPEHLQDGEAMAEGHIAAWREFGHDVVLLENGTAALAEAMGCAVEYLDDSAPVCHGPAITSLDEVDRLVLPDPATAHPLRENLRATRIVTREIGDRALVMGRADQGPFSLASMLLGMEEFLATLAAISDDRPERSEASRRAAAGMEDRFRALLEVSLAAVTRYARAQVEAGAHMTSIGESIAGPDVCSPRVYRTYEWGYAKRMVDDLRGSGIRLAYHICGDATAIVEDMVGTGATVLELDYKVDLARVKAATRGRATVLGPIDPSGVLALGTPSDVDDAARHALEVMAPGGGFILGPGCALPPATPPENIHALVDAARRWGRYD